MFTQRVMTGIGANAKPRCSTANRFHWLSSDHRLPYSRDTFVRSNSRFSRLMISRYDIPSKRNYPLSAGIMTILLPCRFDVRTCTNATFWIIIYWMCKTIATDIYIYIGRHVYCYCDYFVIQYYIL